MRLTEDVNDQLYAQADIWFSGDGDPGEECARRCQRSPRSTSEHGALLRAIVEVSTYDEEVARFWRGCMGRFVDATRAAHRARAGGRPGARRATAEATAFALCWMTERVLYQRLVQEQPLSRDELVERARAHLGALRLRLTSA